ncbi:hypothetical protein QR680_001013 [Steinernema hermaphroditum]|uniref:EIF-4F 25 kDa subunit n=1 Tax=Steinernema hermaphroditum TaxID=289476 RepID=A0AA39GWU0_9BILA|nr:hypothetical protein QR680_001013 [Steinernema hermaphroditum]
MMSAEIHPLNGNWAYFYTQYREGQTWQSSLNTLAENIASVEDFWRAVRAVHFPAALKRNEGYFLFKTGIKPMWEDPINQGGGRILLEFPNRRLSEDDARVNKRLDDAWKNLMMALVGEQFSDMVSKYICGAAVGRKKKSDKISLWLTAEADEQVRNKLKSELARKLNIRKRIAMPYESHASAQKRITQGF